MAEPEQRDAGEHSWLLRAITALTGPWNRSNLFGIARILVVILFIKGCVIDQYTIPSASMEPTLHGDERFFRGDRVLVNKWIYGPRIPFTTIRLWDWSDPQRWEIVVFSPMEGASEHATLVKRVVGLPGERIRVRMGGIEVNGEMFPLPPEMPEQTYYYNDLDIMQKMLLSATPQEQQLWEAVRGKYPLRYGVLEEESYLTVPEGHYFLLGDNSLHSVDSRVFGWVPKDHILGRTFAIWWPWPRRRDFTGFSDTWWGMLLLYGVPLALLGYETFRYVRQREMRKDGAH